MIRPKFFIVFVDLLLAYVCLDFAYLLRFDSFESLEALSDGRVFRVACYLVAIVFSAYLFELYEVQQFKENVFCVLWPTFRQRSCALTFLRGP